MTGLKRLTPPQSRKVNSLVKKECCNCDNGHCILLDDGEECVCPQLISYSLLCKWFQTAVLPLDKLLYAELYTLSTKNDVLLRNRYQKRTYIKQGADSLLLAVCALFFYFIRAVLLYPLFGFPIGYTALHSLPL